MRDTFWTHTVWYVILGVTTIVEILFFMAKAKRRSLTFGFFLTILGLILNFETIILIYFKAYYYYPMIVKSQTEPFHDALAGNLFSQFSVAATILLVVVYNLRYYWYFIFAAIYGMIEEAFLALGIYRHAWYRTWMTLVLLPFAFWAAKKMYKKVVQGIRPLSYYIYIFLGLFPLDVITLLWGLMLSGHIAYNTTVLRDPISSRYILCLPLAFFPTFLVVMLIYFSRLKWIWKFTAVLLLYLFYYLSYKLHLVWIKEGWFLAISTVLFLWVYLSVLLLDRLYGGCIRSKNK